MTVGGTRSAASSPRSGPVVERRLLVGEVIIHAATLPFGSAGRPARAIRSTGVAASPVADAVEPRILTPPNVTKALFSRRETRAHRSRPRNLLRQFGGFPSCRYLGVANGDHLHSRDPRRQAHGRRCWLRMAKWSSLLGWVCRQRTVPAHSNCALSPSKRAFPLAATSAYRETIESDVTS
jgi:hypothetical protein